MSRRRICPTPDDALFLECAITAAVPLGTGNMKHDPRSLTQGAEILPPATYWKRLSRAT